MRVTIDGRRFAMSTRTRDRAKAEAFLNGFLQPFGLGGKRLALADAWDEYVRSPYRRELAAATMRTKRLMWARFTRWIAERHPEITELGDVTPEAVAEYLRDLRAGRTASAYNVQLCAVREIFRTLAERGGVVSDPWAGVRLMPPDSHSRRELTVRELRSLLEAARRAGGEWPMLFTVGAYTGMRLGDCCRLDWADVDLERRILQIVPGKTRRHGGGRPVTIPIHPALEAMLRDTDWRKREGPVMPYMARTYCDSSWRIDYILALIFRNAGIRTSVRLRGRGRATPDATFHSLRHTFVSFATNAGVPLPVVQSIVGHSSPAMTRHYYHANEAELRRAVESVPSFGR